MRAEAITRRKTGTPGKPSFSPACISGALISLLIAAATAAFAANPVTYDDVSPIFKDNCTVCHSGEGAPKGLRLDTYGDILRGSRRGPVIMPGSPRDSELVRRIKGISQPRMPLTGPPYLSDHQISLIEGWIAAGAPGGVRAGVKEPEKTAAGAKKKVTYDDVSQIFKDSCTVCHSGEGAPKGLRLDSFDNIRKGSIEGAVVVPGNPEKSELIRRVRGISKPRMPLTGPPYLPGETIALIERWILDGAERGTGAAIIGEEKRAPEMRIPGPGEPVAYFHVAPIFLKRCVKCHAEKGQMGGPPEGLILKSREQILAGGERAVVIPGNPGASLLVRHIEGRERPRMPFDGPPYLSDEEIRLISDWISQGAPDDEGKRARVPAGARVRLEGTLTGYWEVDGTPLRIGSGTRIKKRPLPGDRVEVRGTLLPDGSISVERIRRR